MAGKVLLLNLYYDYPTVNEGVFSGINKIWQPISLAYTWSLMRKAGVDARLLDCNALRIKPDKSGAKTRGYDIVVVSSTSYDRWECPHLNLDSLKHTCENIKHENPDITLVLSGSHVSSRPLEIMKMCGADFAVIGEPEKTLFEISQSDNIRGVNGVAYLGVDDELKINPPNEPVDLNSLPPLDYSQLPMDKYHFDMMGYRFAVYEISRGCPYQCTYCLKNMFGGYRQKNIEKVKEEIDYLVLKENVKNIFFLDLEFTLDRRYIFDLCDWIMTRPYSLRWSAQTRFDTVDEELLQKMSSAGCKLIMYGVESGSERILSDIEKNIKVSDFKSGIEATKKAGISSCCFYMFGFIGETDAERDETVKLALEMNPDYASFFLCRPYPGTKCYEQAKDISPGLFPLGIGDDNRLMHLKKYTDDAFAKFYYRPSFLLKRLLKGDFSLLFNQIRLFLHKRGWFVND